MITVLQGSPQYSIDSEGLMTIATTWIVMPKDNTLTAVGWLAFQNEVEAFAGKPGDKYKMPKIEQGREATSYDEVDTFRVDAVSWECASGRTHYEVTFSNVQNLSAMRMIGNVSVERNENNETTKTINYRIDLQNNGTVDPMAIDAHLIESGTSVNWAGTNYRVTSTSYTAQTAFRYDISITAEDMSVMLIGEPSVSIDGFGVRTASATWQYSTDAYLAAEFPEAGDDAADVLGGLKGYIVNDISVEPKGKAGYNVTFNAVHVETKLTSISAKKESGSGTEYTYNYKTNKEEAKDFLSKMGTAFEDEGLGMDGTAMVSSVSVDEESRGNYNVTLTAKTPTRKNSNNDTSKSNLSKQVSASGSPTTITLTPRQCGWATMVNGSGIYPINHPPTTMYSYPLEPEQYLNGLQDSGVSVTTARTQLWNAIVTGSAVGFDRVVRVYDADGKEVPKSKRSSLSKWSDVSRVIMQGFVYAQPTMTRPSDGSQTTFRNIYFEHWNPYKECPIMPQKKYIDKFPEINGRWSYLNRMYVNRPIAAMEFNVTKNYKGNLASVLKKRWSTYMHEAIKYIRNDVQFTSYRCISLNPSEITDDDGDAWTSISVTIQALAGLYWNPRCHEDYPVYYVVNA